MEIVAKEDVEQARHVEHHSGVRMILKFSVQKDTDALIVHVENDSLAFLLTENLSGIVQRDLTGYFGQPTYLAEYDTLACIFPDILVRG